MKILFLTTHLNAGGISSYLLTLSKGLIRRGHEVHLVSAGGDQEDSFRSAGVRLMTVDLRTKSELSPKIYLNLFRLKKYIFHNRIEMIHANTRITQVMGRLLQKLTGAAYVSTCHGFFRPRLFRKMFGAWGERVIAVSPPVKEHLLKDFSVDENRICLIENGIDLEQFTPAESARKRKIRKQLGYTNEILIGLIARFSGVKGQDILIQAMPPVVKKFPDAHLLLIGHGKEENNLKQWVERLSLKDRVHFHPVIAKTADMLAMLDIVACPSRNEGLGLSIMEAQAMGLPVVATRVGGIPGLIQNGETGLLVDPEDSSSLSAALMRLCGDPDLRMRLGHYARQWASANYSSERMTERTLECYHSIKF